MPFLRNHFQTDSYEEDVKIFGRKADKRITFHGDFLDENQIKEWWSRVFGTLQFLLLLRSCSDIVSNALSVGGATDFVEAPYHLIWTPERLYEYCERLQWNTYKMKSDKRKQRVATDFEYIFDRLKNDAADARKQKQELDKKRREMKKKQEEKETRKKKEDEQNEDMQQEEKNATPKKKNKNKGNHYTGNNERNRPKQQTRKRRKGCNQNR